MHVLLLPWRYRLDLHRATMRMVAGDQEKIRSWEWKRKCEQGGGGGSWAGLRVKLNMIGLGVRGMRPTKKGN